MEGLEQYSHVWVVFVFHCNTDLQRLWSPDHGSDGLKAKVQVPRLNGGRMGVLATRSPHRPCPIGEASKIAGPDRSAQSSPSLTTALLASPCCAHLVACEVMQDA